MSQLEQQITQYRKMATDDPENELGHFRLGKALMDNHQFEDATRSFRRTLELSPQFSKVYQLLGTCLAKLNRQEDAIEVLNEGFEVADERGDTVPRDEMSKLLVELGQPAPVSKRGTTPGGAGSPTGDGFRCQRPGCPSGPYARRLPQPPMKDELGQRIYDSVCADCWDYWLRNLSIKVINEMRLDLSTERGQEVYDQVMRETLGLDQ